MRLSTLVWLTPVFAALTLGMVFLAIAVDRLVYPYHVADDLAYLGAGAAVAVLSNALISAAAPRRRR